ncbi:glycosyltransferase family 2 protein [Sporolactobacillus pectinivorans]|uniref:glycosyltransferase family 2 protein n=1 Tax=Sporolactobacillus pectinivorans TaxID=1591408 RepID=UPI000C25F5B1|nr:glycosyltransferase family 2 protein [Sporolactobacillus pectinivorans]
MQKIIAIVVTYNRKELLIECLNAIKKQTYPVSRIVVVDNASNDGTDKLFSNNNMFDQDLFDYQRLPQNIGGAGGFHEGFKYASQLDVDWLWIMDDDTIPRDDSLEKLIDDAGVLGTDNVSFLASSVFGPENEAMNVPVISGHHSISGYPDWYFDLGKGLVKIESATFVSLLINNQAIKKIGLPVKDYFIWGDDTEYTLRLTHYFGPAFLSGKSKVLHKRANVKKLIIEEETNINRVPLYYYLVRNILITRTEYFGRKEGIKGIILWGGFSVTLLFRPKVKYRVKKFLTVQKGILDFIFRQYDYKRFSNRMTH